MIINEAIQKGTLNGEDWNEFKAKYDVDDEDGTMDECCIHIPLRKPVIKGGDLFTFICIYLT